MPVLPCDGGYCPPHSNAHLQTPCVSGALLDLHRHLRAVLDLAFPFLHLACIHQSRQRLPPIPGPRTTRAVWGPLTKRDITGTALNLWRICRDAACRDGTVFSGADGKPAEARDELFLLGRSCPSLLIGNNNPCPWSTLKNNPALGGLEVRPEAAVCEHPGKEVGSWPRTSTGAGMVAGCCCHPWLQSHIKVSMLAARSPLREPQDIIKSHWEIVLKILLP